MTHFTRLGDDPGRVTCRICGLPSRGGESMFYEEARPGIAFHERCIQTEVGDRIDRIRALLERQQTPRAGPNTGGRHRLDIHELAALLDQMRTWRDEFADRLDELERLGEEAFRRELGSR